MQVTVNGKTEIRKLVFEFVSAGEILEVTYGSTVTAFREGTPATVTKEMLARALEFANKYTGQWTAPDMSFVFISGDNSKPAIMFAQMFSGGQFPSATILDAVPAEVSDAKAIYKLKLKMNDTGMIYETDCVYTYTGTMNGMETLELKDYTGVTKVYSYYRTFQLGGKDCLKNNKSAYIALGEGSEGQYWLTKDGKEYLRVMTQSMDMQTVVVKRGRTDGSMPEHTYSVLFVAEDTPLMHTEMTLIVEEYGVTHFIQVGWYNLDQCIEVNFDDPAVDTVVYYSTTP